MTTVSLDAEYLDQQTTQRAHYFSSAELNICLGFYKEDEQMRCGVWPLNKADESTLRLIALIVLFMDLSW